MARTGLSLAQKFLLEYYRASINLAHAVSPKLGVRMAVNLFQRPYPRKRFEPLVFKQAEKFYFKSAGTRIAGYKWQPKRPVGKKFLILHGFAGSSKSFDHYIKPAMAKGYEVYTIDAPGHGNSEGKRLNVLMYSWVIEDVIRMKGPFDAILAHSLSGMSLMLALEKAANHRQPRVMLVAPLVKVSTAVTSFQDFLRMRSTLRRDFEKDLETWAGRPMSYFSLPDLVRHHRVPIYWFHDRMDDTTPFADLAGLEENPPDNLELIITEGLGHSGIYRDNKVKKKVIQLLGN